MIFDDLLKWSSARPLWQQDALRRLAETGELKQSDLEEIRSHIEAEVGISGRAEITLSPLSAGHLNDASKSAPRVVLASVGPVRNVDRLADDQKPMRFARNGITIIYGPNASGKSGYCRILKQLCRSVAPSRLRGNIFEPPKAEPAEIAVAFGVGRECERHERSWKSDTVPPHELRRISVFDTASARLYVDEERKITFLPYELDLLNKLGVFVRSLEIHFRSEESRLLTSASSSVSHGYSGAGSVHELVSLLTPKTQLSSLPNEEALGGLAEWRDIEEAELKSCGDRLKSDPASLVKLYEAAHQALMSLRDDAAKWLSQISDVAIENVVELASSVSAARAAEEVAAKELFIAEPIPNVGSETWRQMFRYAREFAAEVFPESAVPKLVSNGRCVLCQQDLSESAQKRMAVFDEYILQRLSDRTSIAEQRYSDAIRSLRELAIKSREEVAVLISAYSRLDRRSAERAEAILSSVAQIEERHQAICQLLVEGRVDDLSMLPACAPGPSLILEEEITFLNASIEEFNQQKDEAAYEALSKKYGELNDRKKLRAELPVLLERLKVLKERWLYRKCMMDARVAPITRQLTERRREILTPSLREALEAELTALNLTHIPISLEDRGDLGESVVEVALTSKQRIGSNSDVLSEGEQRGLALACFLAELTEIGGDHGIVVDDPVSSLDHGRMNAVANRLACLSATNRQVIVFTHNLVFHHMIRTAARVNKVAVHEEWISSVGNTRFGILDDASKPWHIKSVGERLSEISGALIELKKRGYEPQQEQFREGVVALYTKMRMSWERCVEDTIFNKVVQRFRPEVLTQRLTGAFFNPKEDYPNIFEGMKRCSHYSGHDIAEDLPIELPLFDSIQEDVSALKDFCARIGDRRNKLEKEMTKYEEGISPEFV